MEELSLSLPEDAELQPVGTVSSIIQQLGRHMHIRLMLVETFRVWSHLSYFSYCPVSEGFSGFDGRHHPLQIWSGGLGQGEWTTSIKGLSPSMWCSCIIWCNLVLVLWFQVFEIFGPVSSPLYILRFNSADQISDKGLKEGLTVYYAPTMKEYTGYILVQELKL